MRRIAKLVAGVTLAGVATLGAFSAASPAMAGGSDGSLVDVTVTDVLTGNETTILQNVSIPVAAVFCGINVNTLTSILANTPVTDCKAASIPLVKKAYVKKH